MSEMSDVIKKPLSTAKRWVMRAGIRREGEQLEKQRDGEEAAEKGSAAPQKLPWWGHPHLQIPGAVPPPKEPLGLSPLSKEPSRSIHGRAEPQPVPRPGGPAWPWLFQASERRACAGWVSRSISGSQLPPRSKGSSSPAQEAQAVVAPLCFFQRRRHKAPLLLAAAEMSSALPSLPGISGAATRGGLQAGAAQPPCRSLPAAWHRFPRRAACADNAPRVETPRRTHQAPTRQTPEAGRHAPSLAWALL